MSNKPFKGRVKLADDSSLRKFMRAARRGTIPSEQMGIIGDAVASAKTRRSKYLSSSARRRGRQS